MKEENSNNIWELLGKTALALGVIWSIIQISEWAFDKDAYLVAEIENMEFHHTPFQEDFFDLIDAFDDYDFFDKVFESIDENNLTRFDRNLIKGALRDSISEYKITRYSINNFVDEYSKITIKNYGEITSKNTQVDINSFNPEHIKIVDDGETTFLKETNVLSLGDIRPNEEIIIIIWSSSAIYNDSDISLSYDQGVGKIKLGESFYGLPYFFKLLIVDPFFRYSILLLFLFILFMFYLYAYEAGVKSKITEDEKEKI